MGAAKATPNRSDTFEQTASGRDARLRDAARNRDTTSGSWGNVASFTVAQTTGDVFPIAVNGRVRWALERLLAAGEGGCTPIDNPAPRWSGYIHVLREIGVEIETLHEPHGGDFPGHHGRYVLRSSVTPEGGAA